MALSKFFSVDLEKVYSQPTPDRLAKAYFNRLWRKLHIENFSLLIVFYGKHRVGKSLSAVDFCYILDETFEANMESRIVYTSRGLIQAFKDIKTLGIKGGGIVVDEAGSGDLSNMRWYEELAKVVSAELQAVGYLNPLICFVTQNFSFINTTARKLSQGVFEVNRTNNLYSTIKPFWIENNPWITGFYRKYPIFCESRGNVASNVYKINKIKIGLPPKEILERYKNHSQAFKDQLLISSEESVNMAEFSKTRKRTLVAGIEEIVKEVVSNADEYKSYSKKKGIATYLNENIIQHRHNLSMKEAKLVKALSEKEMYRTSPPNESDMNTD
jgi:hypothetical protein